MSVTTIRTSSIGAAAPAATNYVDATTGAVSISLGAAAATAPGTSITVIKTDASGNAVTVEGASGETLGVLADQADAVTANCDGVAWTTSGATQSAADVAAAVLHPTIDYINSVLGTKCCEFPPSATSVNYVSLQQSATGSAVAVAAVGTDSDIDLNLVPNGTGVVTEKGTPIAIQASAQADSTAILLADLVTDFNDLLAKLRTGRMLAP